MNNYKIRPGVVLTEICGEYILVSMSKAKEDRPYVMQVNESSAFIWKHMSEWINLKKLVKLISNEYEIEDTEEVTTTVDNFLTQMTELGYLLKEEES